MMEINEFLRLSLLAEGKVFAFFFEGANRETLSSFKNLLELLQFPRGMLYLENTLSEYINRG